MRRADREIREVSEILKIVDGCQVCRLGLADEDSVYIVPLSFGYSWRNGKLTLYFHGAREGRKMELIRRNGKASFEMDLCGRLVEGENGCQYSVCYQSVMGEGRIEIVKEPAQKELCLRHIMAHYTDRTDLEFSPQTVERTCVLRLEADWLSAKARLG